MAHLTLHEAQLMRVLARFFGAERVIPHMSVMAACGGELPDSIVDADQSLARWARANRCLFTIVDHNDDPKLVVEFFGGFEGAVVFEESEHQRVLPGLFRVAGIDYVTFSPGEFQAILDTEDEEYFAQVMHRKVESGRLGVKDPLSVSRSSECAE